MLRCIRLLLGVGLFFLFSNAALAQGPSPQHTDPMWQASYWNNKYQRGEPTVQRSEDAINHDWGNEAPAAGIENDAFSARWTRYIDVPTARTYHFGVTCDDGMRIYVDNALILDEWHDQPAGTMEMDRYLNAGHHLVVVEYYENAYNAVAKFWMSPDAPSAFMYWRGEYYNNISMSGDPAFVRDDPNIDFRWNESAPVPGTVNADHFSVRWTRNLDLPAGNYRFALTIDDGARLWVNGHLLIDTWRDQWVQTYTGDLWLPGGSTPVKLEYYEHTGGAFATLTWATTSATINNWRGEYYNNTGLSGGPVLTRDDAAVNFDWGGGSPAPGIVTADRFSVRWTRNLDLAPGNYRFTLMTDDGARLWVNGHLLIDRWYDQAPTTHSGDIWLSGNVPVRVEYYENQYNALIRLSWSTVSSAQPRSTVVVDETSSGFTRGGSAADWHVALTGFNGRMLWTYNSSAAQSGYNWARWYPGLQTGRYEVFALIPNLYSSSVQARYWVSHSGGMTLRIVNQNIAGDHWASLGTYTFNASSHDFVSLSDVTYEGHASRMVAFDAVKWEPR